MKNLAASVRARLLAWSKERGSNLWMGIESVW